MRRVESVEPLSAAEVWELLDAEHPWDEGEPPSKVEDTAAYDQWQARRSAIRRARRDLAAKHGWTVIGLFRERFRARPKAFPPGG